eukprot:8059391-Ditylum_brightwellii.AAC.1
MRFLGWWYYRRALRHQFDGVTLRDKFDLPGVVGDIMPTVFTTNKEIWQIETTKDQIVDAMRH